jgi:glyoxylate/hydroxypyruvate reductase A
MNITFCCSNTEADLWLAALRVALPQAHITLWQSGAPLADYAIVWVPPQAFFDQQTALKGIFNIGAGVDALMRLRLPKGVPVVRLTDAGMGLEMAEYVCQAVAEFRRDFAGLRAAQARGQWQVPSVPSRQAFNVGIMGFGVLGQQVAKALRYFEYPVNAWSQTARHSDGIQHYAGESELGAFLAVSQVVVCLLPRTPQTENLLNHQRLSQLPQGAYLINVARGALVVDQDLLALLDSGHLKAAWLDVFRQEPLPPSHPFWHHPAITLTPHISAPTQLQASVDQIAHHIRCIDQGLPVPGQVALEKGY